MNSKEGDRFSDTFHRHLLLNKLEEQGSTRRNTELISKSQGMIDSKYSRLREALLAGLREADIEIPRIHKNMGWFDQNRKIIDSYLAIENEKYRLYKKNP